MAQTIVINLPGCDDDTDGSQPSERELLTLLISQNEALMTELLELREAVARVDTVTHSAVALIEGLAARLEEVAGDEAAVRALAAELTEDAGALGAAVEANTPAPPADVPVEDPGEPTQPVDEVPADTEGETSDPPVETPAVPTPDAPVEDPGPVENPAPADENSTETIIEPDAPTTETVTDGEAPATADRAALRDI